MGSSSVEDVGSGVVWLCIKVRVTGGPTRGISWMTDTGRQW